MMRWLTPNNHHGPAQPVDLPDWRGSCATIQTGTCSPDLSRGTRVVVPTGGKRDVNATRKELSIRRSGWLGRLRCGHVEKQPHFWSRHLSALGESESAAKVSLSLIVVTAKFYWKRKHEKKKEA
jgi:hypothetical protein